jgi:signal transduction histidine kinase
MTPLHQRLLPALFLLLALCHAAHAQAPQLVGAAPGLVETGAPRFIITTPESMGLVAAPTDIQLMPDGRLVAVNENQIAIGDGLRWEVYQQAPDHVSSGSIRSVLVDHDGVIYTARGNSVGRVDIGEDGYWRMINLAELKGERDTLHAGLAIASQAGGEWFWHGVSGTIALWRPGIPLRRLGSANVAGRVFAFNGDIFLSDTARGSLYQVRGDALVPVRGMESFSPSDTITGSAVIDPTHSFVGTFGRGLQIFDGNSLHEAAASPPLSGMYRISDLCPLEGGLYAAAVTNVGIVFFDRQARIVQSLETISDHRFAHVQRLLNGGGGQLWALLNEGVARISFPSRLSHFESMVDTGIGYALPLRHEGRLWLCGDGLAQRGIYTAEGRLLRFSPDSPAGRYVYTLCSLAGADLLVAGTDQGLYALREGQWIPLIPSLRKARVFNVRGEQGRWFYTAQHEVGWLVQTSVGFHTESRSVPTLDDVYGMQVDDSRVAWLELGSGSCARIDLTRAELNMERFTQDQGLGNSWVQCFLYHGRIRVSVGSNILRFNNLTNQFEQDTDLTRRNPSPAGYLGRGAIDAAGHFWISSQRELMVWDESGEVARRIPGPTLRGELPYYIIPEDSGVMWFHSDHHLQRFDPAFPEVQPPPVKVLLTRVSNLGARSNLQARDGRLPPVDYSDNSLSFHFAAIGAPPGETVSFEAFLEGENRDWAPVGSTGVITFSKLREGSYTLHVRPRMPYGAGEELTLAFGVQPPWFRSTGAYIAYLFAGLALIGLSIRAVLFLQHRDRERLESVVFQRTAQLNETNRRLAEQVNRTILKAQELQASEERGRRLNEELEKRVLERTAELNEANERLRDSNRELESFSYSVSHDLQAPLRNISGFAELLQRKAGPDMGPEQRRYIDTVAAEASRLGELIRSLLNFSRIKRSELRREPTALGPMVAAVRAGLAGECNGRYIEWRLGELPVMEVDPILMQQVFANLLGNAVKFTRHRKPAIIEVGVLESSEQPGFKVLFVKDNGAGFDPKYSDKLFGVFQRLHHPREFEGTGIGLANVRQIVTRHGGRVWAEGRVDDGATFFFSLPLTPKP